MIQLMVLLAKNTVEESLPIQQILTARMNRPDIGIEIVVDIVTTLAEVKSRADSAAVIIMGLHLADAEPEEVIESIHTLPKPIIIFTQSHDPAVHAACKMAGASMVLSELSPLSICRAVGACAEQSVIDAAKKLPN